MLYEELTYLENHFLDPQDVFALRLHTKRSTLVFGAVCSPGQGNGTSKVEQYMDEYRKP